MSTYNIVDHFDLDILKSAWEQVEKKLIQKPTTIGDTFSQFLSSCRDSPLFIIFPYGIAYFDNYFPNHSIVLHMLIWSSDIFRNIGSLISAVSDIKERLGLVRMECNIPHGGKGMAFLLKQCKFNYEGTMGKWYKVGSSFTDADKYAIIW